MENKKRLIDADALIKHLGEEPMVWCDGEAEIQERDDWRRFKAYIEAQDTIDAVEVVRCRDCKYIRPMIDAVTGEEDGYYCALNLGEVGFDDFCSYGERKDNYEP